MTAAAKPRHAAKEPQQIQPAQGSIALMLARFRLLAGRRAAWLQALWSSEVEHAQRGLISHGEVAAALEDRDSPEAERAWDESRGRVAVWKRDLRQVEMSLSEDRESRLARLRAIFGLNAEEQDLLEACLSVAVDPSLARVCAYLQDRASRTYMTEELAARLYRRGRCGVWAAESPLFRWELIESHEVGPGEPKALVVDPHIRDWVLERETLEPALVGIAHVYPPRQPLRAWRLEETVEFVRTTLNGRSGLVRVAVAGAPGSGRRSLAAAVSAGISLPMLAIDADAIEDARWANVFIRAQRHAFLQRCALAWHGESAARRAWPRTVPLFPVQFVILEEGHNALPLADAVERRIRVPRISAVERASLWREYLPEASKWPKEQFLALVRRYRVVPGDIASAARVRVADPDQAARHVRESARSRLGDLAQRLPCPFGWCDLVVSSDLGETLRDITFEAKNRVVFWEQKRARRMFPQGRGLMVLLSGPPGTGKTMTAQVIAGALGYDLFRLDLSTVVSKFVGETSKNMRRVLTRAADMDAVLLFDEADAMISRRATEIRDAQDKFANTDSAYLLQAIESYPGISLLATNQKGNIDPAFLRRLRYILEFTKPDAGQRLAIWTKVIGGLVGEETGRVLLEGLKKLSESVDATGAQIKNAVLGAIFVARRRNEVLGIPHLLRALERELAKEGRTLGRRDREAMQTI